MRNPLNGTLGHLRLAKQLVAETEASVDGLAEEVDQSIAATELAVQYLGTLATLHGALTGSRELVLAPTELTELVRSAASVVRQKL